MSKTRNLSDLLDANGDVKSTALDNVPASNDASALTTGTLDNARLATNVSVSGDLTVDTDTLKVDATNNRVGIGTATPQEDLHIYHPTSNVLALIESGDAVASLQLKDTTSTSQITHNGNNLKFNPSGVEVMHLSSLGRVGVGTNTPLSTLHLDLGNSNTGIYLNSTDATTGIALADSSGSIVLQTTNSGDFRVVGGGDANTLGDNSSEVFRVSSSGTVTATAFSGDGSALTNVPAGVSNVNTVVVTSSGTYTPTSGTKFVTVYATGGGGGGGSADWNVNNTYVRNAGAGGGGGTAIRTYDATELGSNASITIGSGGGGGGTGSNGSTGGNTSFNPSGTGSTITGNGGRGGVACWGSSNTNATGQQGIGGNASGGQVNVKGHMGEMSGGKSGGLVTFQVNSSDQRVQASYGGGTFWGGNTNRQVNSSATNGGTGSGIGVGGNGAHGIQGHYSTATGGSGASGIVVIMEYA